MFLFDFFSRRLSSLALGPPTESAALRSFSSAASGLRDSLGCGRPLPWRSGSRWARVAEFRGFCVPCIAECHIMRCIPRRGRWRNPPRHMQRSHPLGTPCSSALGVLVGPARGASRGVARADLCRTSSLGGWPMARSARGRIWAIFRCSGSGFGRGADSRDPGPIRRIGPGPRTSAPWLGVPGSSLSL